MNLRRTLWAYVWNLRLRSRGSLIASSALAVISLTLPHETLAQSVGDPAGKWTFACAKPPAVADDECALTQSAVLAGRPTTGITLAVVRKPGANGYSLRFVTPLGVLLPKGLTARLDDKELGKVGFIRCSPNGCMAQAVDAKLVERMRTASVFQLTMFDGPNEPLSLSFNLSGLSDSLQKSLPLE